MGFFDTLKHELRVLMNEMDQDAERERIMNREAYDRDTLKTTETSVRNLAEKEIRALYVERQKSMVNQELRERDTIEKKHAAFFNLMKKKEMESRELAKEEGWVDANDLRLDVDSEDESDFVRLSPVKK